VLAACASVPLAMPARAASPYVHKLLPRASKQRKLGTGSPRARLRAAPSTFPARAFPSSATASSRLPTASASGSAAGRAIRHRVRRLALAPRRWREPETRRWPGRRCAIIIRTAPSTGAPLIVTADTCLVWRNPRGVRLWGHSSFYFSSPIVARRRASCPTPYLRTRRSVRLLRRRCTTKRYGRWSARRGARTTRKKNRTLKLALKVATAATVMVAVVVESGPAASAPPKMWALCGTPVVPRRAPRLCSGQRVGPKRGH